MINFKNFKIEELTGEDVQLLKLTDEKENNFDPVAKKVIESEFLTIGANIDIQIHQGSENLYFDFLAYLVDDNKPLSWKPIKIQLYTKDNHPKIKNMINTLIQTPC